ncbi:hypothetical protein G9A89_005016 [Geosiphon pyriformis]|nr:hypothetical protein G9A89_005016 [Geosiphon pyriformis]
MSSPIFRIQKSSKNFDQSKARPSHLAYSYGGLTIEYGNQGAQRWSFVASTTPQHRHGIWIINIDENLALKHYPETGELALSKLNEDDPSFVWSINHVEVWKGQIDYSFSPYNQPHRRLTYENVLMPIGLDNTFWSLPTLRLNGDAGSPANQAWIIKMEKNQTQDSTGRPEAQQGNTSINSPAIGAY